MSAHTQIEQECDLASVAMPYACADFMSSRQTMQFTPATLRFDIFTSDSLLSLREGQGVTAPHELTPRLVRQHLAALAVRGYRDHPMDWLSGLAVANSPSVYARFRKGRYSPALHRRSLPDKCRWIR